MKLLKTTDLKHIATDEYIDFGMVIILGKYQTFNVQAIT
jgi:hypothetical protein